MTTTLKHNFFLEQETSFNITLNSETASVGIAPFNTLSIIYSSVFVHSAQFRVALRYVKRL
jgi:hypothetical protein